MSDEEIEILIDDKSKKPKSGKSERYKCPRCVQGFQTTHGLLQHIENHKFMVKDYVKTARTNFKNGKYSGVPPNCPDCQEVVFPSNSVFTLPLQSAFNLLEEHKTSCTNILENKIKNIFFDGRSKDSMKEDNTDVIVIDGDSSSEAIKVPESATTPICDSNETGDSVAVTDKNEKFIEVLKECFPSPKYNAKDKSLTQLTLLEYLDNCGWSSCPLCPETFGSASDCLVHLLSHSWFMDKLEADTDEEETYICQHPDCKLNLEGNRALFLMHKFRNCKCSSNDNIRNSLKSLKMDEILMRLEVTTEMLNFVMKQNNATDTLKHSNYTPPVSSTNNRGAGGTELESEHDENTCVSDIVTSTITSESDKGVISDRVSTSTEKTEVRSTSAASSSKPLHVKMVGQDSDKILDIAQSTGDPDASEETDMASHVSDIDQSKEDQDYLPDSTNDSLQEAVGDGSKRKSRTKAQGIQSTDTIDIRDNVEDNKQVMSRSLKCYQCFKVFKESSEAFDVIHQKHHFCATEGNLSSPLKIDPHPTPTKLNILSCIICVGKKPVFEDQLELMKNLTLAHKASFFKTELLRRNFSNKCYRPRCNHVSKNWEEAILHISLLHEQLFWALKHDRKQDYRHLIRRLFPEKYRKNPNLEYGKSNSVPGAGVKRKLDMGHGHSSVTPPSNIKSPGKKMSRIECHLCSESLSNSYILNLHLVSVHYYNRMLQDYPLVGMKHGNYPCGVGDCQVMSKTMKKRLYHIGEKHGVFDKYKEEGVVDAIDVNPLPFNYNYKDRNPDETICEYCWEEFTLEAYKSHPCCIMFQENNNNEKDKETDIIDRTDPGEIVSSPVKKVKLMRRNIDETCTDSEDENGDENTNDRGDISMKWYECEAVQCYLKFKSPKERDEHQSSSHNRWKDF